ncbi:MAG: class II fructose-1,6-bisphosphate aldolase [Rickettsiales bacterium]|jgi:fructose-bisphosphate aldolase class II|nr:class II fructose-1,6-bisphosphate aldolase [Rickettsiales bacterium]
MTHYKKLGFSNTKKMLEKAYAGGYAVPAYNFNNMEQIQAIILACLRTQSPVIAQVSAGARKYADADLLMGMAQGAMAMMGRIAREKKLKEIPVALHLDHGANFSICRECIDSGFSSVMIDGSSLSYEENVRMTREVVDYAHRFDVSVEGELGVLSGVEDDVSSDASCYTKPEQVKDFVEKTGADSLAISIGTSHGAYKFKVEKEEDIPPLRFDILEKIQKILPNFPIVLHGASSVPQEAVKIINKFGGDIKKAFGVPEEQLRKAAKLAVCKINVDSDGRLWTTAMVRKVLAENPAEFDPRKYLGEGRDALIKMYSEKNGAVFGSANTVK